MISSDNVKAGLMLAAGLGVAYVVYRGYRAASGAASTVAGVVQSVGQGISDGMSYVAALPSKTYESLAAMESYLLTRVLKLTAGNQSQASRILGITRGSLRNKIHTLKIQIENVVHIEDELVEESEVSPEPVAHRPT